MKKEIEVKVIQHNPEAPVVAEVIAECIVAISEGVKRLRAGKLNDKAIYLLIQHSCPPVGKGTYNKTKPGMAEVKAVIEGMESLQRTYLKPAKEPKK